MGSAREGGEGGRASETEGSRSPRGSVRGPILIGSSSLPPPASKLP